MGIEAPSYMKLQAPVHTGYNLKARSVKFNGPKIDWEGSHLQARTKRDTLFELIHFSPCSALLTSYNVAVS